jgi:acylphosphatase
VVAQGDSGRIRELVALIEEKPTQHLRPGEVESCVTCWGAPREGVSGFVEK